MLLKVKRVRPHSLDVPGYAKPGDAGIDLPLDLSYEANEDPDEVTTLISGGIEVIDEDEELVIMPNAVVWVRTGWAFEIPYGFEGQVRGRSGLAFNHGVSVAHLGTIDSGFRGEIKVCLVNRGETAVTLAHGDRIGQLVISTVTHAHIEETGELASSSRGETGFGSSGP